VFVLATFHHRVPQLVQEEDHAELSTLHRGLHGHLPLVRLPPLAPRRGLQDRRLALHASSVVRLGTMLMLVRWEILVHQLRTSNILLARGYSIARVNQASADATPDGADIALGMFYINAIPATILFDSGATHTFMSARYANTNEIPLQNMKTPMIVITPKGHVEATHMTHRLTLTIMGREFWATAIILEASSIDLILGMSCLRKVKASIQCGRGTIELTSPKRRKISSLNCSNHLF
jgi:predicted aspartyl protease